MKTSNLKTKMLLTGVALALAFASSVSQASIIGNLLTLGTNEIQDRDLERIIASDGTIKSSGVYAVGDTFQTVMLFDSLNSTDLNVAAASLNYQLMGISELEIVKINLLSTGATGSPLDDIVQLVFGATGNLTDAGSLVDLYESNNPTLAFDALSSATTILGNIAGTTLLANIGFGDANDFWTATTINDISVVAGAAFGSGQAAAGVFGLSILNDFGNLNIQNNGILSTVDGNKHDLVGDVSIFARENKSNSDWLLSSNINASFNVVPEPATLGLLALGLMGMGAVARRRK